MKLSLFAWTLLATLLPVEWKGIGGWTYTLQHSFDMMEWEPLCLVCTGTDATVAVLLELAGSPVFARLRSSTTGDTNDNGLPDQWEWSEFGQLDMDPEADPDLDGASNLQEWTQGTDPLDYFNGQSPILTITCGTEWLVIPGEASIQSVSLVLAHVDGTVCPDAPVLLNLPDELGLLQDASGHSGTEMIVYTDALGRIHPGTRPIHYLAPVAGSQSEYLEIQAGRQLQSIRIHTTSSSMGGPPRSLLQTVQDDGSGVFQWSGDPGQASVFFIERQSESGEWERITELAIAELPQPDPESGHYTLVVEPLSQQ